MSKLTCITLAYIVILAALIAVGFGGNLEHWQTAVRDTALIVATVILVLAPWRDR